MSTHGPLPNQGYSNHGRHPSSSERNVYHHGPPLDQSYTEHTHAPHCQRYRPASGHISPVRDRQSHILSPSPHQPYSHTLPDALINPVYFHRRDLSSNEKNNYHTSKLSASSSIYSSPNYVRNVTANVSVDSKSLSHTTDTLPSSASSEVDDQHSNSHILFKGTRRMSDASSLQPVSVSESTGGGSHRNTRELGDFYDSYWRQSTLSTSTLAGRGGDFGKQTLFNLSNSKGVGEMGMDSRRPGQMDLKVATIVEVPSPLPSPMPGTAL